MHHQVDEPETSVELEALVHNVRHAADRVMELSPNVPEEAKLVIDNISTAGGSGFLAANLSLSLVYRQELLETFDVKDRLRKVYAALSSQLEVLELPSSSATASATRWTSPSAVLPARAAQGHPVGAGPVGCAQRGRRPPG
ncbi:MAG: hypothetical protein H6816_13165 [Phycisphaerales bacterium]|nr:hypothetical protein [Phycisphaerales bacterium]